MRIEFIKKKRKASIHVSVGKGAAEWVEQNYGNKTRMKKEYT